MKTFISIIFLAVTLQAQDFFYLYDAPAQKRDCPPSVMAINLRDKTGDLLDYRKSGLGCMAPDTLVDARTGYSIATTNIPDGMSNLCARAVAVAYDASTNYTAAVIKVTGNGKKGLKEMRKADKKAKPADAIDALTARLEMLEALLRQRGIMTPGAAMQEEP